MTEIEKRDWDDVISRRDEAQQQVTSFVQAYRKARNTQRKATYLRLWVLEQKSFDHLNDNLPRRYHKELSDRSWAEEASRPGEQKYNQWQDE